MVRKIPISGAHDREGFQKRNLYLVLVIAAHVPLALFMQHYQAVATVHALGIFGIGAYFAASGQHIEKVAYVGGYIVGAEVLWRMTEADVFWEFGKYATIAIFIVAMVRIGRLKMPTLPLLYFLLLIPSSALTVSSLDIHEAREQISFNLSGPFALLICAWFFFQMKLTRTRLFKVFMSILLPLIGVLGLAAVSTWQATDIRFGGESNFITSGGFGPNQVSAVLGLGALILIWMALLQKSILPIQSLMLICGAVVFIAQSILTFSRGGVYIAVASITAAFLTFFCDNQSRLRVALVALLGVMLIQFIIWPNLEVFTEGAVTTRFQDVELSGRYEIILSDWEAWKDNFVFGVGPGQAKSYREIYFRSAASHSEYSRLLAEHGIFGFFGLILLVVIGIITFKQARHLFGRVFVSSFLCWSYLFMLVYGMRLVAPSFLLGLVFASLDTRAGSDFEDLARRVRMSGDKYVQAFRLSGDVKRKLGHGHE